MFKDMYALTLTVHKTITTFYCYQQLFYLLNHNASIKFKYLIVGKNFITKKKNVYNY